MHLQTSYQHNNHIASGNILTCKSRVILYSAIFNSVILYSDIFNSDILYSTRSVSDSSEQFGIKLNWPAQINKYYQISKPTWSLRYHFINKQYADGVYFGFIRFKHRTLM